MERIATELRLVVSAVLIIAVTVLLLGMAEIRTDNEMNSLRSQMAEIYGTIQQPSPKTQPAK